MALLKEFKKNVEVVVEILEHWSEVIEQHFIYEEDLSTSQTIKGVTVITSLGMGLKEKALHDVSVAMYFGSALWKNSFNEILMWLNIYMPEFKSQIGRQYSKIVNQLNAILSAQPALQGFELIGLRNEIGRLANDLRSCANMAREEWEYGKDGQSKKQPKKIVQKSKYTPEKIKNMLTSYDKHFEESNDVKYAWNCVAEEHSIKSGKAAEMAVRRHQEKNK